jgi:hypothetical protein
LDKRNNLAPPWEGLTPQQAYEKGHADAKARRGRGHALERGPKPPPQHYDVDAASGCWEWNRGKSPIGYGNTRYNGRGCSAHRAYYAHYVGPIPAGSVVMHSCDNPSCVNPEHLVLGLPRDNSQDMQAKGRSAGFVGKQTGEAHHRAKLTADDVREIRRRMAAGESRASVARAFDTSPANVWGIVIRRYWKHVD